MKQFSIFSRLFITLVIVMGMMSCNDDNDNKKQEYKYFVKVTKEQHLLKKDLIIALGKLLPGIDIEYSPLSAFITDLDVVAITYKTTGVDGKPTIASGVIAIPSGSTEYDHLLSIQHSTLDMEEAPTIQMFYYDMLPVFGNNITIVADYLGYGASQTPDRQHPYLHNASTGVVCADMIEAAQEYLADKGMKEKADKIDLIGYSQGANSTVATLFEMEKRGQASRIRAVHAGAGCYDLLGILQSFTSGSGDPAYPRLGYLPYIIRGMSYGEQIAFDEKNIYSAELLKTNALNMFNTKPLSQWHEVLGGDISKIVNADFFASPTFNGNKDIINLLSALGKNSLINHDAAKTPITLYHSKADDFITYESSLAAKNKWNNATLIDLNTPGHVNAGMEFMLRYMGVWDFIAPKQ